MFKERNLECLVSDQIARWQSGQHPDAAGFLSSHPELERDKSLALDLIQQEYRLRAASGDTIVKSTFCDQFPAYRRSVAKMLEVEEYLDQCPQFAVPPDEDEWPQAGGQFLGYDIVQPLGRGSLARVYLAREPALGKRLVVIKVSRFGAGEAATLGRLAHENIVPIYSVQHDEHSGWTAICMPLVGTATGVDLLDAAAAARASDDGSWMTRVGRSARPLSIVNPPEGGANKRRGPFGDAIARLGLKLADGLAAAHAQGVVHHDLKPSNVLLDWSGRPMLLDFNLSTDLEADNQRVGGTLAYMAPEQIASLLHDRGAAARQFDPRADIYSLGVLLYELLTGRLPAQPAGADQLPQGAYAPWLASKLQPPAAIRSLAPRTEPWLEAIVLKCLAADPAKRYATASELAADLRAYLGPAPAAKRFAKRNRWSLLLAAGLLLGLAISAAVGLATRDPWHVRLLNEGLAQYSRKDYPAATESFTRCLEQKPGSIEAHFARGQAYWMSGDWARARADFTQLERADRGWAHLLAGCCDLKSRDDLAAKLEFQQAHAAGLHDRETVLRLAFATARGGNPATAIAQYASLLARNPADVDALRGRIDAYQLEHAQQRVPLDERPANDAERLCGLLPKSARAHHQAAVLYQALSKQAAEANEEALAQEWAARTKASLIKAIRHGFTRDVLKGPFKEFADDVRRELGDATFPPAAAEPSIRDLPLPTTPDWPDFLRQVGAS